MSGRPNPAWRLSRAQATRLRSLLRSDRRDVEEDGPNDFGGYGIEGRGAAAVDFLAGAGLPRRIWIRKEGDVARFLAGTAPCYLQP